MCRSYFLGLISFLHLGQTGIVGEWRQAPQKALMRTGSRKEYLVKGGSNRIAVRVRHESTTVSCGPICDGACVRDAGPHTRVTIRPARKRVAVGIDYGDEEGQCEPQPHGKDQCNVPSSHTSEGSRNGRLVLLMGTA